MRYPTSKLNHLQASNHFTTGILQYLSMFGADRSREWCRLTLHKLSEPKENAGSPNSRCARPGTKSLRGGHDSLLNFVLRREGDAPGFLATSRIKNVRVSSRRTDPRPAINEVMDVRGSVLGSKTLKWINFCSHRVVSPDQIFK